MLERSCQVLQTCKLLYGRCLMAPNGKVRTPLLVFNHIHIATDDSLRRPIEPNLGIALIEWTDVEAKVSVEILLEFVLEVEVLGALLLNGSTSLMEYGLLGADLIQHRLVWRVGSVCVQLKVLVVYVDLAIGVADGASCLPSYIRISIDIPAKFVDLTNWTGPKEMRWLFFFQDWSFSLIYI